MNVTTFIHFLNQKPSATSDCSFSLISYIQFLSKSYWYNIQLFSASDYLSPLHYYHGDPSHHFPLASSTIASSLFSWLSRLSSNHQQNPLLIALFRLYYSTPQNLPEAASHTWYYKAYRHGLPTPPTYLLLLCPIMFLLQSLCIWCFFCLECPSLTNLPDTLHHCFQVSDQPHPLYLRGFFYLNCHSFITHYFPTLLHFSSHVWYLALYYMLLFNVFGICIVPVCVTLFLHIIPLEPRAVAAHNFCWIREFNPGPFFGQYFS